MARALRRTLPLLLGAGCLVLVAACGSSNNNDSSSSASTPASTPTTKPASTPATGGSSSGGGAGVKLAAVEGGATAFGFNPKDGTAKAGSVTLTLDNPSSNAAPHGIAIEGNGVDKDGKIVQPGGTSTVTVDLKPGKYEFYCPVPGHRQAGMQGELVVK